MRPGRGSIGSLETGKAVEPGEMDKVSGAQVGAMDKLLLREEEEEEDNKYLKRGREQSRQLQLAVACVMLLALAFALLPSHNSSRTVRVSSEVRTVLPSSQGGATVLSDMQGGGGARVEAMAADDAPVAASRRPRSKVDKDTGLSLAYPKYENSVQDSSMDMVLAADEPSTEDGAGAGEESEDEQQYDEGASEDLFEDQAAFEAAPTIKVMPESKVRKYSKIVLSHERYYRSHPSRLYVPRLKKTARLSVEAFRRLFMDKSQPVVVPFEAMRHLNFTTKAGWTLEELKELYPNSQPKLYKYGAIVQSEIDLGPAVTSLMANRKLKKTQAGKSYPRNTKFALKSLKRLDIEAPAVIPSDIPMMLPSLWFASTAEATPLHSDCCDNWAMMVAGTKKWYLAPPSEARILKPNCAGGLCWVKKLPHADSHTRTPAEARLRDNTQLLEVDLPPGHLLYLPAGWFHHVEQEEPTVMINFWAKGGPSFLKYYDRLVEGSAPPPDNKFSTTAAAAFVDEEADEEADNARAAAAPAEVDGLTVAGTST